MKPVSCLPALALALGLAAAPPSHAALVAYAAQADVDDGLRSDALGAYDVDLLGLQLLSLPRFDAAFGTLQSAEVFLSGTWTGFTEFEARDTRQEADSSLFPPFIVNDRNDTAIDISLATTLGFRLLEPSGAAANFTMPVLAGSCFDDTRDVNGVVGCNGFAADSLTLQSSLLLGALPLSSFIGTDPLNLSLLLTGNVRGYCDDDDRGDLCSIEASSRFQGIAGVRYTYATPGDGGTGGGDGGGGGGGGGGSGGTVSVPEPGSLGLLALGLLGIGLPRMARSGRAGRE